LHPKIFKMNFYSNIINFINWGWSSMSFYYISNNFPMIHSLLYQQQIVRWIKFHVF
jgi:hypothetical protein